MKTIFFLIAAVATTIALPQTLLQEKWSAFKATYNKQYSTINEEVNRQTIFNENLANIEAHNTLYKNGEVTYYKAINQFGDLTPKEFLAFVNRNKSRKPKIDKNRQKLNISSIQRYSDELDWRTTGLVSEVKNEQNCGSSWSFSAIGAVEGQLALKTGQVTSLSEQNLIDCSANYGNDGCHGGSITNAYSYISDNGIMSEEDYPYEGKLGTCRFDPSKSVASIRGYYDISIDEDSLKNAIEMMGPVAAAVDATEELQFYKGGIWLDEKCDTADLNHGVLVVGFGTENGNDYWIVKNSWGNDWGEGGYYRAIRNHDNNCGIATSASLPVL